MVTSENQVFNTERIMEELTEQGLGSRLTFPTPLFLGQYIQYISVCLFLWDLTPSPFGIPEKDTGAETTEFKRKMATITFPGTIKLYLMTNSQGNAKNILIEIPEHCEV